jgi:hypothetical protein
MEPMRKQSLPPEVLEYFRQQGEKGGKLSGKARMEKLTPEQRSEIAKKASKKAAEVRSKKAAAKKKAKRDA